MDSGEPPVVSRGLSTTRLSICFALILASGAAYLPASRLGFIDFDDPFYVSANKHIRDGFTWSGLKWAFTSFDPDNWFPLTRLSHMLDYALFGLNAPWHHDVNILIHALASVLLFEFLRRATRQNWPSAFVAAVFALHPLHVESVAWISERKDVLCAFFWFAALWAWVRYAERPSPARYLFTLLLFAAGLMSKPMMVTLPLLLPVLDIWPLRRPLTRKSVILQLPFWAFSLTDALLTVWAQSASGTVQSLASVSLAARFENALITVLIYVGKTFWPSGLSIVYPWPAHEPIGLAALAGIAIAGISALVLTQRRDRPWLAAGWFWFLITLLPVIGLVQVGPQARADRYMYVPMVGLLIIVGWGAADIVQRFPRQLRWPAPTAACLALTLLARLTWAREQYWDSAQTLFRQAVAEDDQNYLAWELLGATSDWNTELAARIECYRIAAQIRPDLPEPHGSLGRALLKADRVAESIAQFETALRISPRDTRTRCNLGAALLRADRVGDAVSEFGIAVRNDPDSPMARNNLAVALWRTPGREADARKQLEKAISLRPDDPLTHSNLGLVLLGTPGGAAEAVSQFVQALAISPRDVTAHLGLAKALVTAPFSDTEAAASHMNSARQLESDPELQRRLETLRMDYGQER